MTGNSEIGGYFRVQVDTRGLTANLPNVGLDISSVAIGLF